MQCLPIAGMQIQQPWCCPLQRHTMCASSWQALRPLQLFSHHLSCLFVLLCLSLSLLCLAPVLCFAYLLCVSDPSYDKSSPTYVLYWSRQVTVKNSLTNVKEGCMGRRRKGGVFTSIPSRSPHKAKIPGLEMSDTLTALSFFPVFV